MQRAASQPIKNPMPVAEKTGIASGARAAAYALKVKAKKLGEIKGDCPWKAAQDQIQIYSWEYSVVSPRDPASGQATGKRMHNPVEVVGKLSKAAPLLFNALVTNDSCECLLTCFTQKQGSSLTVFYTVELKNANISKMEHFTHELDGTLMYRIAFTYETIVLTWKDGNITAEDDWMSRA